MLAAGVDIKVVSETLGHSDTRITRDVYQAVLDDLAHDAAEKVVRLVPRTRPHLTPVPDSQAPDPTRALPRMQPPKRPAEEREKDTA